MVGPRIGRYDIEGRPVPFKPNSVSFVAAGTLILWAGFYGFNAGSVDLGSLDVTVSVRCWPTDADCYSDVDLEIGSATLARFTHLRRAC